jgi:hypothetical protein
MERPAHVPEGWERYPCINIDACGNHIWLPPGVVPGFLVFAVCSRACKEALAVTKGGNGIYVDLSEMRVKPHE